MFAPICCETLMLAATRPSPLMSDVRSGAPWRTTATSETRSMVAPFTTSGVAAMSSTRRPHAGGQHQVLQPVGRVAAHRLKLIGGFQCVGDVTDAERGGSQLPRIDDDLDLAGVARSTSTVPTPGTRESDGLIT